MKRQTILTHRFVESAPDVLEEGILYVSIEYTTAIHKCCCGCGREVVTPITPTDWKLIFDGKTISLEPSIGNWSLPCQSHYWIRNNQVRWAGKWTQERIRTGRAHDAKVKQTYFSRARTQDSEIAAGVTAGDNISDKPRKGILATLKHLFKRR